MRITDPAEVATALADPRLQAPEPGGDGALAAFRRAVSRFANGGTHAARRAATVAELAAVPVETLRERTHARVSAALPGGRADLMPVLRTAPVAALAEVLGVPDATAAAVRVAAIAPAYPTGTGDADRPVRELAGLLGPDRLPTTGCLLLQACEATAGLAANTLARVLPTTGPPRDGTAPSERPAVDAALDATLRLDPPVRRTTRVARDDLTLAGRPVPSGTTVVLDLGPRDDAGPLTFGSGPRACPGRDAAFALAAGAVAAAWHVTLVDVAYGPPGNLRLPTRLEVIA